MGLTRLERLEISGFKSFAKKVVFDFSSPIVAIVGPNGSGKSNVVEAVKWVLGEQSLKELRSKNSSDLIFSGSASERAFSSAKVSLIFENLSPESGLDFEKIAFSRQIWKDGLSEYFINDSSVRLKDIIEFLAKIGLSGKKYLIINQGETDRILTLSAIERREAIEDALGLKIYHLKLKEASQKIEKTEENISRTQILRQEIKPHLNFLEKQVKKFEKAAKLREEIKNLYGVYLAKEDGCLKTKLKEISRKKEPIERELNELKIKSESLSGEFSNKILDKENEKTKLLENRLDDLRQQRLTVERSLGKLEGFIELEKNKEARSEEELVAKEEVGIFLGELETFISSILEESAIDRVYELANETMSVIHSFSERMRSANSSIAGAKIDELIAKKEKLGEVSAKIVSEENKIKAELENAKSEERRESGELRNLEKEIFEIKNAEANLKDEMNLIKLEEEKVKFEEEDYIREKESAKSFLSGEIIKSDNFIDENERRQLRKDLERLKIKIEDGAGYDESVLKEYEDVSSRDKFLEKELADLEQARGALNKVMDELKEKLNLDFKSGLSKINNELENLFSLMFEGGKARLYLTDEGGIDILISLPRKKIKSLEMLSGGERSLVSIALIFALIETNPPPFLILDETDAALDEANSLRYAKILDSLSKRTQLVTITHNRQTMNQAGSLYGVTMDKSGYSRILSLKFESSSEFIKEYAQ